MSADNYGQVVRYPAFFVDPTQKRAGGSVLYSDDVLHSVAPVLTVLGWRRVNPRVFSPTDDYGWRMGLHLLVYMGKLDLKERAQTNVDEIAHRDYLCSILSNHLKCFRIVTTSLIVNPSDMEQTLSKLPNPCPPKDQERLDWIAFQERTQLARHINYKQWGDSK